MATFCTKCGVALSPDKNFCPSCGAAVVPVGVTQTAAGALADSQPTAYQAREAYPPAAAPPASSGAGAVKIILILVAVVVGLGLLLMMVFAFGAWRVSRAVHLNRAGNGVTFSTRGTTVTAGGASTVSDADLGVPAYPGASRRDGGVQIHTPNGSMVTAVFMTADPTGQVIAFYRNKLGESASVIETGQGAIITSGNRDKEGVMVTVTTDPSAQGGGTRIAIVHSKNNHP